MSDPGPLGDDEPSFDPLSALGGVFGDLARLAQQQGPLNWDAARQLALSVVTGGPGATTSEPNVDPLDRMAIEQLARVAELHVARVTGLATSTTGVPLVVEPVTRTQWVLQSLDDHRPRFERLAAGLRAAPPTAGEPADALGFMAPLMQMLGPMMLGMTAGSMVGHLAQRCFGEYDLPLPRPPRDRIGLLMGNIDRFGSDWSLERDDLRLWVCIHEVAHHAVLGVPHLRARLDGLLDGYLDGFRPDAGGLERRLAEIDPMDPAGLTQLQEAFGDPEVLLGAIRSPEQEALLPQLDALVAVVIGVVDHVMDEVGAQLIASYAMVTEATRRRRVETGKDDRFAERLLGLELTPAQVERGQAFVAGVLERGGHDALARLWDGERELPTPAEVDAPGLWLARIDLPDDA